MILYILVDLLELLLVLQLDQQNLILYIKG